MSTISAPPLWFIFQGDKLVVQKTNKDTFTLAQTSPDQLGLQVEYTRHLGRYQNSDCFLAEISNEPQPEDPLSLMPLRALLGKLHQDHFTIAGRGLQILHFQKEQKFCGKCGNPTKDSQTELVRKCPVCDHTHFPIVSPAVIMSIVDGEKILLGRSPHFPRDMYSTLAGFVEPGETLEEAVKREVLEEVNIEVNNIQYVGSQPWPFPHSMMIGFSTDYCGGKINVDYNELEDAQWFSATDLPSLPRGGTIARHLIDKFIHKVQNI